MTDALQELLESAGVAADELTAQGATKLWVTLRLGDTASCDDFLNALRDGPAEPLGQDDELHLRVGGWRIDLARESARGAVLSAIAAAALASQGMAEIGIALATAIIPTLLDVERIELRASDRRLLVELRLKPKVRESFLTEDELYDALPAKVRRVVNRYDFADFVARLRDAGRLEEDDLERLRPRDPDDRGPLVSLR